ncbi:MAG: DUF2889 domain-containing protein [Firmicutes bacterium]|nr:DUF2889 domain-containing protein [Bacillota bacterium]
MEFVYQSNCFASVNCLNGGELLAQSFYLATDSEAAARIRVDAGSFRIKEAGWEIYRSPGGRWNGGRELPELVGVEAYFNAGGHLRRAAGDEAAGLPRELLAECVRGIIQSETYIFTGRGHATARAYEDFWEKLYAGSCRYYSNLDRVKQGWFDHVGELGRSRCLYNRNKSCTVYRDSGGGLTVTGAFCDSFHELGVRAVLDPEGVALAVSGDFKRAPDAVCFENKGHLAFLPGKNLACSGKKEVAEIAGGPQGCNHLVDLLYDMAKAARCVIREPGS